MTQLSNVPMQPKPDAVERPQTLIEKLEQERNGKAKLADYYKTVALEHLVHGLDTAIGIVKQHSQETCNWRNNKDTDGWYEWSDCGDYSSDCGLEWNMSNDDSPLENDMNFCPKCGRKIVEIQPPSEVQDETQ